MNYFVDLELFSCLSEQDQLQLSAFCQTQTLAQWEVLFRQWDEPQAMYVISSGELLVQKELPSGISTDVAILREGDLVWETAFFGEPPTRNATIIANETTTVVVIIKFGMVQMMDKYPGLYTKVKRIIEERT